MTIIDQIDAARHQFCREWRPYPWGLIVTAHQLDALVATKTAAQRFHQLPPDQVAVVDPGARQVRTYSGMHVLEFVAEACGPLIASEGTARAMLKAGLVKWA